jgi:hypothetical protein
MTVRLNSWLPRSRTFWLGLLVTAFLAWLMVDSFANFSVLRTIHRGSLKDWSYSSQIPAGTPDETGSLMLLSGHGVLRVTWLDEIGADADYSGDDERGPATGKWKPCWLPVVFSQKDEAFRSRGALLPTWIPLSAWLIIWAAFLKRSSSRRFRHFAGKSLS